MSCRVCKVDSQRPNCPCCGHRQSACRKCHPEISSIALVPGLKVGGLCCIHDLPCVQQLHCFVKVLKILLCIGRTPGITIPSSEDTNICSQPRSAVSQIRAAQRPPEPPPLNLSVTHCPLISPSLLAVPFFLPLSMFW